GQPDPVAAEEEEQERPEEGQEHQRQDPRDGRRRLLAPYQHQRNERNRNGPGEDVEPLADGLRRAGGQGPGQGRAHGQRRLLGRADRGAKASIMPAMTLRSHFERAATLSLLSAPRGF